jgi:hypothetical protein
MLEELKLAAFRSVPNAATLSHPCMVTTALLRISQKVAKDTKERSGGARRAPKLET